MNSILCTPKAGAATAVTTQNDKTDGRDVTSIPAAPATPAKLSAISAISAAKSSRPIDQIAAEHRADLSWRRRWYTVEEVAAILGVSLRTVRDRLAEIPGNCVRPDPVSLGRPRNLYDYHALPALYAWHAISVDTDAKPSVPSVNSQQLTVHTPAPTAPDDLALAELRATMVEEYLDRARMMPRDAAARLTCMDWNLNPKARVRKVAITERLDGGHHRTREVAVQITACSPKTLRRWAALYGATGRSPSALAALLPARKGVTGRTPIEIPDTYVTFFAELWQFNDRTSAQGALAKMASELPPELAQVSVSTWMRRARQLDPHGARRDMNHSLARYRRNQLPAVEVDWDSIAYNDRWELDDVQMDWYAMGEEYAWLRPWGYAIMRASTRQWVAFAATATPPTHEDVRALIGFALTSPHGGIPKCIKFERGTVACKPDLKQLLELLGITVSVSSMDGGPSLPGMAADSHSGNPRGKALIEGGHHRMHQLAQFFGLQVGTEERHSAPRRLENSKALMVEAARRYAAEKLAKGEQPVQPSNQDWMRMQVALCNLNNNTPHSGMPKIIDPNTGKARHMTPNERADQLLAETEVRCLEERMLMRFVLEPKVVPVNPKTGFSINGFTYGRAEPDLMQHAEVTVFGHPWCPDRVYVRELGRMVSLYRKAAFGDTDQLADQKRAEFVFKNKRLGLLAKAAEAGHGDQLQAMFMPDSPYPKTLAYITNKHLGAEVDELSTAFAAASQHQAESDARFIAPSDPSQSTVPSPQSTVPSPQPTVNTPPRRGILSQAGEIAAQLDALGKPFSSGSIDLDAFSTPTQE